MPKLGETVAEKPVEKPGEEKPIEEKPVELSAMAKKLEADIVWLEKGYGCIYMDKADLTQVSTHKERVSGIYALYGLSERIADDHLHHCQSRCLPNRLTVDQGWQSVSLP